MKHLILLLVLAFSGTACDALSSLAVASDHLNDMRVIEEVHTERGTLTKVCDDDESTAIYIYEGDAGVEMHAITPSNCTAYYNR